jgi:hypothetical protein
MTRSSPLAQPPRCLSQHPLRAADVGDQRRRVDHRARLNHASALPVQRDARGSASNVERFEGFVDRFTGNGIMALFGAPIAHEDHAQRACYAALYLTEELRRYANELRLRKG